MKTNGPVRTRFLNVDLEFKCSRRPDPVVRAFGNRVLTQYVDRTSGRHWLVFVLAPPMPKSPQDAIRRFAELARELRRDARTVWRSASKEFDIGVQAGFEPSSAQWVLESEVVEAAARVGAQIRFTVYSPLLELRAQDPAPVLRALAGGTRKATRLGRRRNRRRRS